MAVLQIGRIGLDVDLDGITSIRQVNDAREGVGLRVEGYLRGSSLERTNYLRHELLSIAPGTLVAVSYSEDPEIDGFYWFRSADVSLEADSGSLNGVGYMAFTAVLMRVGDRSEVMMSSRISGAVRTNDFSLSSSQVTPFVGFPQGSATDLTVWWGSAATPTRTARTGADGTVRVYYDKDLYTASTWSNLSHPRWAIDHSDFYDNAVTLTVNGYKREGTMIPPGNLDDWSLDNGIIKISPNASNNGYFDLTAYASSAWQTATKRTFTVKYETSTAITSWSEMACLKNLPHIVILRFTALVSSATRQMVQVDLTLRRGSRFAELRLVSPVATVWCLDGTGSETMTKGVPKGGTGDGLLYGGTTNTIRYCYGSASTDTFATTNGGAITSTSRKTWSGWLGVASSGETSGGLSTELAIQFLGVLGEDVRPTLR